MQDGAPRRPDAAQSRYLRPTRSGIPTPSRPRRNGKKQKRIPAVEARAAAQITAIAAATEVDVQKKKRYNRER